MQGYDKKTREHQTNNLFFIHNSFGSFFSGVLNWFGDEFYPRFNYKVIGTYDKAIEFFKKKKELGVEVSTNLLPSITLDPMIDFSNEERGGKFLWQHARYAPGIGLRLWRSVDLKEQSVVVTPVFSRYQGTFEVTFWLSSIYELMDFRVALLQFCGGFQRWCRPETFWTYLILPDAVENYQKQDGNNLDWGNTLSDVIHVETINKHKRVIPLSLEPIWRLESFSDASTKHGGDSIAEYKLTATFGYEINLPTYVVTSENLDPTLSLSLSLGSTYSKYPIISPYKILQAMETDPQTDKYIDKNYNFYSIEDEVAERDNKILEFNENSVVYPTKLIEWNYITSGTLLYINDEFIADPLNKVSRCNIVIMDSYKPAYLPYLRRACAAISVDDHKSSDFYSKCDIMKKPCVCLITEEEKDAIIPYVNQVITLDSRRRRIYEDELAVIDVGPSDPEMSFNTVEQIKEDDPEAYDRAIEKVKDGEFPYDIPQHRGRENVDAMKKRLITDHASGVQTLFPLGYIIDDKNAAALLVYVDDELVEQGVDYTIIDNTSIQFTSAPVLGSVIYIGGEFLVIKESKLAAIYEFTEEDLEDVENPTLVDLPQPIDRKENIILVSYGGRLEYGRDYEINFDTDVVTIYVKPVVGEIVQFFYYV